MDSPNKELTTWLKKRPKWLHHAAQLLLTKPELSEQNFSDLFSLCKKEANDPSHTPDINIDLENLTETSTSKLKLIAIDNIKGINALNPKTPLEFGDGTLSVIYGGNGSGKSGYVRILKHICNAKAPGSLLHNVFKDPPAEQGCNITYIAEEEPQKIEWLSNQGSVDVFKNTDIYDTSCGRVYVTEENEVAYEPKVLIFISDLIKCCEHLSSKIQIEVANLICKKPEFPDNYKTTEIAIWYKELNHEINIEDIKKKCQWKEQYQEKLNNIAKRLAENSPKIKAQQIREQIKHLESIINFSQKHLDYLSDDICKYIMILHEKSITQKSVVEVLAQEAFNSAPLEGVGSKVWIELWEAAKKYSIEQAYKDKPFPYLATKSRCVLCQQELKANAIDRLGSFEKFIKGEAKTQLEKAEKCYYDALDSISDIQDESTIKITLAAASINNENYINRLLNSFKLLRMRLEDIRSGKEIEKLTSLPSNDQLDWLIYLKETLREYEKTADQYEKDAKYDQRPELNQKKLNLEALKWVSQQEQAIADEVRRLKKTNNLNKAKLLTKTNALSLKKGALAEELVTPAFVIRFNKELMNLGAKDLKVVLVRNRTDHGRVFHLLKLENSKHSTPLEILSEGEFKIVSLAAFLADVTGRASISPFIFDDPISSLDQNYEEAVVLRLVELSKKRQVIIFTHRLSLLGLIQDYVKKEGVKLKITHLTSEPWGTGNPGDTPLDAKRPDKALGKLLNERLSRASKEYEENGKDAYYPLGKALCSDFRILLERMIEFDLLADVVSRFRRAVTTMGKIDKLAKITKEDCKYFDKLMTKYSKYEHSQSTEAPVELPLPDELRTDLETLKEWHDIFVNRSE